MNIGVTIISQNLSVDWVNWSWLVDWSWVDWDWLVDWFGVNWGWAVVWGSFVDYFSNISRVSISGVVGYNLGSAVWKKYTVLSRS